MLTSGLVQDSVIVTIEGYNWAKPATPAWTARHYPA